MVSDSGLWRRPMWTCYSSKQAGQGPVVRSGWATWARPRESSNRGDVAMAEHHLDPKKIHFVWNNELPPAITVQPGDTVHCWTQEVSNGQVTPGCSADVLHTINFDNVYPLAGPIAVDGAAPGDALEVEILSLKPDSWGWTGILPGLGLLSEEFNTAYIRHFDLSDGLSTRLGEDIVIPLQPFCGTMGVAPAEPGTFPVLPPRNFGGNMA